MDKIEILSAHLLKKEPFLANEFKQIAKQLHVNLGWHYLLDLIWSAKQLGRASGLQIMDAGAGSGIMQWWLASQGAIVLSVDRSKRILGHRVRAYCPIYGLRPKDFSLLGQQGFKTLIPPRKLKYWHQWLHRIGSILISIFLPRSLPQKDGGSVILYNQDLSSMPDIKTNKLDAIISISALEHNSPEKLRNIVQELMRVLKPGAKLIATLAASKNQDWLHKPSNSWCYTEATLQEIFQLSSGCLSNYRNYDELFLLLRNCAELKNNLADFYFKSGNNGMPWGVWDPKYQPVGVIKEKPIL